MNHPQAARTSCRFAPPLKGATPAARRSRFRGVPRFGFLLAVLSLTLAGVAAHGTDEPASQTSSRVPKPVIEAARGAQCVEEPAFMRRNHMELLKHQRDDTMHGGIRGAKYSLKACIECHASQASNSVTAAPTNFCVSCHSYAAVKIDCFECHATQPQKTSSVQPPQVAQQQVKP
jgi:hypothetical protein